MAESEILLEICVDCLESIKNAIEGGADRLELCSALSEGGLTPTLGLARLAKRISPVPVFAMIRIRGGNFVYSTDEMGAMLEDLAALKSAGMSGFVFGALTSSRGIDVDACLKIVNAARPLPVTFHRAFDDAAEPLAALELIRDIGFARLLTSGQCDTAAEGAELIARLVERSNGEITVMPGSGVTENNASGLRQRTGAKEFHGSAKRLKSGAGDDAAAKVGVDAGRAVADARAVELTRMALRAV